MMTLKQLEAQFTTEDQCMEFLACLRWPELVCCPRCGNDRVYKIAKPWKWQCKVCNKNGYRFSPLTGTIFENTNIPLRTWFRVIFFMTQSKKGMSAHQVHRMIGKQQEGKGQIGGPGSYRTAWYMCHRIRSAMKSEGFLQLMGELGNTQDNIMNKTSVARKKTSDPSTEKKPREKPVSLYPLDFEKAMRELLRVPMPQKEKKKRSAHS